MIKYLHQLRQNKVWRYVINAMRMQKYLRLRVEDLKRHHLTDGNDTDYANMVTKKSLILKKWNAVRLQNYVWI